MSEPDRQSEPDGQSAPALQSSSWIDENEITFLFTFNFNH